MSWIIRRSISCSCWRWCGRFTLICALLFLGSIPAFAQDACTTPGVFENCQTATAWSSSNATLDAYYWNQTQTAVATYYATATPSPALGTPSFLDLLSSPTPEGTAGINLSCPSESFDASNLDPQWALVCSHCVEQVVGTPTPPFGQAVAAFPTFAFQTPDLSTATPVVVTATVNPNTPTITPTPSATPAFIVVGYLGGYGSAGTAATNAVTNYDAVNDWWETTSAPNTNGSGYAQISISGIPTGWTSVQVDVEAYYTRERILLDRRFAPSDSWVVDQLRSFGQYPYVGWYSTTRTYFTASGGDYMELSLDVANTTPNSIIGRIKGVRFYYPYVPPTSTPTPTQTGVPTNTPTPTETPQYWATAFHPYVGWSVNCAAPKYFNPAEHQAAAVTISTEDTSSACWTVIPSLDMSFGAVNNTVGALLNFSIDPLSVEQADVCFVGVSFVVQLFGFAIDMSVVIGLPMLAWIVRWVLKL